LGKSSERGKRKIWKKYKFKNSKKKEETMEKVILIIKTVYIVVDSKGENR